MISLIRRELWEAFRLMPLGLVLSSVWFLLSLPNNVYSASHYSGDLVVQVSLVGSILALALGLLQTFRETRPDVRGYLWHRPFRASHLFLAKTVAGLLVYGVCLFCPLAFVAIHLDWLGPESLPVSSRQAIAPAFVGLFAFVFHPAVIWMMSRRANWFLTRTFPLLVALWVLLFTAFGLQVLTDVWVRIVWLLFSILLFAMLFHAALHSYTNGWLEPPPSSNRDRSASATVGLWLASFVLFSVPMLYLFSGWTSITPGVKKLAMDTDGRMWLLDSPTAPGLTLAMSDAREGSQPRGVMLKPKEDGSNAQPVELSPGSDQVDVEAEFEPAEYKTVSQFRYFRSALPGDSRWLGNMGSFVDALGRSTESVCLDGKIHVYGPEGRLATVSPKGIDKEFRDEQRGARDVALIRPAMRRFEEPMVFAMEMGPSQTRRMVRLIADRQGVYQIENDWNHARLLAEGDFQGLAMMKTGENEAEFWVANAQQIERYHASWNEERERLNFNPSRTYELSKMDSQFGTELQMNREGFVSVIRSRGTQASDFEVFDRDGVSVQTGSVNVSSHVVGREDRTHFVLSPVISWSILVYDRWFRPTSESLSDASSNTRFRTFGVLLSACFSALLTFVAACWQHVTGWRRWVWVASGFGLGWSTPIALLATHTRPIMERCDRCGITRPFDQIRCSSCGHDTEPPIREGIEIFSGEKSPTHQIALA